MKAKEYYQNIESKWKNEYPSSDEIEDVWNLYKEFGYKNPEQTLGNILDKVVWNKKKVLDYGCDKGLMLDFICSKYSALAGVGIDINKDGITQAQMKFPTYQFVSFNGMDIPFEDKSFDLVFVSAVIKHVRYEDRYHVYRELKRVADNLLFIEVDSKIKEEVFHQSWTFYHSHFEEEFSHYFKPVEVIHEAGDILGLYRCN